MFGLWEYRWLFGNFFSREIRGRYVGSISGMFWALLHPLALLGIYTLVFNYIFRVKFAELEGYGFIVFVAIALWPWLAFQEGVQRGALAAQAGASLIKKVAFPHELLVHGAVASTYAVHLAGFALVLLIFAVSGVPLHFSQIFLLVPLLLAQFLFTGGLALFFAALQVLARDVEHFIGPLMMIWFYATPVLYAESLVPPRMQQAILLNPMTYFVSRIRDVLLQGGFVPKWEDLFVFCASFFFFALGRWFFNRLSPNFEDFLWDGAE